MQRDEVIRRALCVYEWSRPWWAGGKSARRAARRAIEWAYDQGLSSGAPIPNKQKRNEDNRKPIRVIMESHRPLMGVLVTVVTAATASAGVTSASSGWVATGLAFGGAVVAGLVAWVRSLGSDR